MKRPMFAIGLGAVLFASAANAMAQDRYWRGDGADDDFDDFCNWNSNKSPCDDGPPDSGLSWRMKYDELIGQMRTKADYARTGGVGDAWPNVTVQSGFFGDSREMTFHKVAGTGTRAITITNLTLHGGVGGERAILDIDENFFTVSGTTTVKRQGEVDVASGKFASLGTIFLDATPGATQLRKLGLGTLTTAPVITVDAIGNNDATLAHSAGSISGLSQLILDGTTLPATGISKLTLGQNLAVSITAAQEGICRFNLSNKLYTANATSVTVLGGSEPQTTLEIDAIHYLACPYFPCTPPPPTLGEFKATTLNITGSPGGSAELVLNSGILRTSQLVKLSNPNAAPSVSLYLESGTITDLNSLELGADTGLTAVTNATVRGELKTTGATTVEVGVLGSASTLEAGSLRIEGAVWQPLLNDGSVFVTR